MTHYTKAPENLPYRHLLEASGQALLGHFTPDAAYYSFDRVPAGAAVQVTLLVRREKSQIDRELQQLASRAFESYPELRWSLFSWRYAEDALRRGNLFFLQHCTLGELAYGSDGTSHPVHPEAATVGLALRRARKLFQRRTAKIDSILLDFSKCLEQENFTEAFFILHRALELMFKQAAAFLTGKAFVSKSIAQQQENLRLIAPEMGRLFDTADAADCTMLELLDSSYWNFKRRQPLGGVRTSMASAIASKVALMKKLVEKRFDEAVAAIEERMKQAEAFAVATPEESSVAITATDTVQAARAVLAPDADAILVSGLIASFLVAQGIYCFGTRRFSDAFESIATLGGPREEHVHFYLLVVAQNVPANAAADLSNLIKRKTRARCTATVLVHTVKSMHGKKPEHLYFFWKAMSEGTVLYEADRYERPVPVTAPPKRDVAALQRYWQERKRLAGLFIEAAYAIEADADAFKASLLHQAAAQLCLGLINTFLGYRPNHFSLGYLFELCECFTPLTRDFFPRRATEETALFEMLAKHPSQLRHEVQSHEHGSNIMVLERRCKAFLEKAAVLAAGELERLGNLKE